MQRRATFQKTVLDDSGAISAYYSINLSRAQMVVSTLGGICVILGSIVGGAAWTKNEISKVAQNVFRQQLDTFHDQAKPAISSLMDAKIQLHQAITEQNLLDKIHALEKQDATFTAEGNSRQQQLNQIQESLRLMDAKIDRLLERKGN